MPIRRQAQGPRKPAAASELLHYAAVNCGPDGDSLFGFVFGRWGRRRVRIVDYSIFPA